MKQIIYIPLVIIQSLLNNKRGIEQTFLLSSGEDSLNALFQQHKIKNSLKLLLLCSSNNRWSDIIDGLHATLFPVKKAKPICSPDLTFKWRSILP